LLRDLKNRKIKYLLFVQKIVVFKKKKKKKKKTNEWEKRRWQQILLNFLLVFITFQPFKNGVPTPKMNEKNE